MEQYNFKGDFTNSVFKLMGRVLLVVILVQVLISLISYLLTSLIAPELASVGQEIQSIMQSGGNPEDWIEDIKNVALGSGAINPTSITILTVVSLLLTLISYNVIFNGIKNEVTSGDNSLGSAVNNVFDIRILKYIALYLLMVIVFALLFILVAFTGSGILIFLATIILIPLMIWFSISYAAVGIDNVSLGESLQAASSNLTIGRWAKTLGLGIVVMIVFLIGSFIIGLLGMLIMQIPFVGPILGQIINSVLGAVLVAFMLAGFSGLYYKYTSSNDPYEEDLIVTD